MNISWLCPECDQQTTRQSFEPSTRHLECSHCGYRHDVPAESVEAERVMGCLVCPCRELYVRKDFSQRLGVLIICLGFLASSITWFLYMPIATYAILFFTAGLDVVLYFFVGNVLQCYRCQSQYRGIPGLEDHGHFNLEVHERYRQELARLKEANRG